MYARGTVIFCTFECSSVYSLAPYPAEIGYFNSPNRELSNGVQVMEIEILAQLRRIRPPPIFAEIHNFQNEQFQPIGDEQVIDDGLDK